MTVNSEVPQKVLEKIQKALALQERASTPEEASAAAAAVARLIAAYNVDIAGVELTSRDDHLGELTIIETDPLLYDSASKSEWVQRVIVAIAEAHFCKPLIRNRRVVMFVGRSFNARIACNLFQRTYQVLHSMLESDINEFGRLQPNSPKPWTPYGISPSSWKTSWLLGASVAIQERLKPIAAESEVKALAVVSEKEISWFIENRYGKVRPARVRDNDHSSPAMRMGYEAGSRISLDSNAGLLES